MRLDTVEGYLNYQGKLCVSVHSKVLTREEATALRDQLNAALAIKDKGHDTEAEAHARMTNAMNGGR